VRRVLQFFDLYVYIKRRENRGKNTQTEGGEKAGRSSSWSQRVGGKSFPEKASCRSRGGEGSWVK
jgi:hypothetical protein